VIRKKEGNGESSKTMTSRQGSKGFFGGSWGFPERPATASRQFGSKKKFSPVLPGGHMATTAIDLGTKENDAQKGGGLRVVRNQKRKVHAKRSKTDSNGQSLTVSWKDRNAGKFGK